MSTPPIAPAGPPDNASVNVPIGAIVENMHQKYGHIIQTLIAENSQLQAGVEAQGNELSYLRSVVAASNALPMPAGPDGAPEGPAFDPLGPSGAPVASGE